MTFHGHAKWEGHDDGHGHALEPHEAPKVMLGPLLVLALGALAAGGIFADAFIGPEHGNFWHATLFAAPGNHVLDAHALPEWVVWAPLTVTAIGFGAAWWFYIRREGLAAAIAARKGPVWSFLYHKWYFDELYHFMFVRGAQALGDLFWKVGDKRLIDGLGPDGVSWLSYRLGKATGRLQTGYVYHYAFVMLLGVAGLLSYALWAFGR